MSEVLTEEELERITGYPSPRWQKKWLAHRNLFFDTNAKNQPIVHWAEIRKHFHVEDKEAPQNKIDEWETNIAGVG